MPAHPTTTAPHPAHAPQGPVPRRTRPRPGPALRKAGAAVLLLCLAAWHAAPASAMGPARAEPPSVAVEVVRTLPHDPEAFTQGLFVHSGLFYESTGRYGLSDIRVCEPETGRVLARVPLSGKHFGEGIAPVGETVIQLTWRARQGLVYDLETLEPLREFAYPEDWGGSQGWGLALAGEGMPEPLRGLLVMSDGSDALHFVDPEGMARTGSVHVRHGDAPVPWLNEIGRAHV